MCIRDRAIADQARTIRIPVHMVEVINRVIRTSRQMVQELGREPTVDEIAKRLSMPVERVAEVMKISQDPVSLETPVGEEEDSHLVDFIQDDQVEVPVDAATAALLREQLSEVLNTLNDREKRVLSLRFGLGDGRARTLEEVGKEFNVTILIDDAVAYLVAAVAGADGEYAVLLRLVQQLSLIHIFCRETTPELREISPGHHAACHFAGQCF